jgi:hypothetical protein
LISVDKLLINGYFGDFNHQDNAMTTITFDTLHFVQRLEAAGIPREQAEVVVRVIADAQETLVTNQSLDNRLSETELRLDARFAQVDSHLIQIEQRLIIKLGSLIAVSVGIVAALVKLL